MWVQDYIPNIDKFVLSVTREEMEILKNGIDGLIASPNVSVDIEKLSELCDMSLTIRRELQADRTDYK